MFFSYRSFIGSLIFPLFLGIAWARLLFSEYPFLSVLWNSVCKGMMMVGRDAKEERQDFLSRFSLLFAGSLISLFSFLLLLSLRDITHSQLIFFYGNDTYLKTPLRILLGFWTPLLWPVLWLTRYWPVLIFWHLLVLYFYFLGMILSLLPLPLSLSLCLYLSISLSLSHLYHFFLAAS